MDCPGDEVSSSVRVRAEMAPPGWGRSGLLLGKCKAAASFYTTFRAGRDFAEDALALCGTQVPVG